MQQSEEDDRKKGLRPPTKMVAQLRIAGSATEQFLQLAGAIAYMDKVADQGVECVIDCNNHWVRDFITAIAGDMCLDSSEVKRLQFPSIYAGIPHQSVIFPIETNRDVPRFSFAVNEFYGVFTKRDHLWTRDCYGSTLGWHVRRLAENRRTTDRCGGVFLAMNFADETPRAQASPQLWKDIIRWLDEINQPIIAPRRFLCSDAKRTAMLYSHIPPDDSIIAWASLMANCRLYIGPDCLLSQLAYSLRVPSIVLSELPKHSYIDRHDVGKYADPLHLYCHSVGELLEWSLGNVTARYNELERILLTEH